MGNYSVIYEDNHLLGVLKSTGTLVQGDITGDVALSDMAKDYIKHRYNKPGDVFLGVIHRIDRPVSGVVVFARTSKALTRMNELFRKKEVHKEYYAISTERPEMQSGTLIHYVQKNTKANYVVIKDEPTEDYKKCITHMELVAHIGSRYLIKLNPETGRSHQLRVQLARIGCPILGDTKYGGQQWNERGGIALHCHKMSFVHPVKKIPISIEGDFPENPYWGKFRDFI